MAENEKKNKKQQLFSGTSKNRVRPYVWRIKGKQKESGNQFDENWSGSNITALSFVKIENYSCICIMVTYMVYLHDALRTAKRVILTRHSGKRAHARMYAHAKCIHVTWYAARGNNCLRVNWHNVNYDTIREHRKHNLPGHQGTIYCFANSRREEMSHLRWTRRHEGTCKRA